MLAEGRVGQRIIQDGAEVEVRLTRTGGMAVVDAHAHFWDAVSRGNVFSAVTAVAPVALGTALTATAVTLTLSNPTNSGRNAVILQSQVAISSNIATSGSIYYAVNNTQGQAIPTSVTPITPNNLFLGNGAAPVCKAYSAATLAAAPVAVRLLAALTSSTSFAGNTLFTDNVDGALILPPGMQLTIQGVGTTALLGTVSMTWEEVIP